MILNTCDNESWWMERMLDRSNMVTSYKSYWLTGIIEIIIEEDKREILFDEIINRMIVNAWFTAITFKLSFGFYDRLVNLIEYLNNNYSFLNNLKKGKLLNALINSEELLNDKYFNKKKKELCLMVPFRLLSPFFKEGTRNVKEGKKNKLIAELSNYSFESMYVIKKDRIIIRSNWMEYIIRNQAIIKGWLQYKLIMYLQGRNPNVPNIPLKINPPNKRNLTSASKFWKKAVESEVIKDIYTGELLNSFNYNIYGELSIDHFIPWSFVSHDEFWNLCPTFKNINSSKSDGVPDLNEYLDDFCDIHYLAINRLKSISSDRKILEDYYTIGNDDLLKLLSQKNKYVNKEVIIKSLKSSIQPIQQIALNQGFDEWKYFRN